MYFTSLCVTSRPNFPATLQGQAQLLLPLHARVAKAAWVSSAVIVIVMVIVSNSQLMKQIIHNSNTSKYSNSNSVVTLTGGVVNLSKIKMYFLALEILSF